MPAFTKGGDVPFGGTFSGAAMFTSETTVKFSGFGNATHPGLTANAGAIIIVGPPDDDGCLPNVHVETLAAASGDQFVIEMHDISCPIAPPLPIFEGTGNWQVIGGTGRSANTTRVGTVSGGASFVEGTFKITLTGRIDCIGRN